MKIVSTLAVWALGSCIALASNSALAQYASNAQISQTGWRLVDLDANDGITPGISFFDVKSETYGMLDGDRSGFLSDRQNGSDLDPVAAKVKFEHSSAGSSFGANGLQSAAQLNHAGWVSTAQRFDAFFTLTPHTRLEYFGVASASATSDGRAGAGSEFYNSRISSLVTANLTENGQQGGGVGDDPFNHFFKSTGASVQAGSYGWTENFTINYENKGDVDLNGKLQMSTYVFGTTPTAPVPEPETYGMMLGGLVALGALARRRKENKLS